MRKLFNRATPSKTADKKFGKTKSSDDMTNSDVLVEKNELVLKILVSLEIFLSVYFQTNIKDCQSTLYFMLYYCFLFFFFPPETTESLII